MKILSAGVSLLVGAWLCLAPALADTGILTWNANTEPDLAGYKVYRSTLSGQFGSPIATLGKVTTYNLDLPQLAVDTTYFIVITAYDLAGNESNDSNQVSKLVAAPVITKPGVPVLTVSAPTVTTLTVAYPSVPDGAGGFATVSIRYAVAPALTNFGWGAAAVAVCTSSPCVITGLTPGVQYEIQAVASRPGTPNVFGALSAVVSGTTIALDVPPSPPTGLTVQ